MRICGCIRAADREGAAFRGHPQSRRIVKVSMRGFARAFTLIELLIVVAIIAILAAIAVPNFLEAQVRSKVARVRADQRTMATAIESYAVDNNTHPLRRDKWNDPEAPSRQAYPVFREKIFSPTQPDARTGLHTITTPIAYLSSLPRDIFNRPAAALATPDNQLLDAMEYWDVEQVDAWLAVLNGKLERGRGKGYMLVSVGPDQYMGVAFPSGAPGNNPPELPSTLFTARIFYDPTNGSVSVGNIYRSSGGLEEKDIVWNLLPL